MTSADPHAETSQDPAPSKGTLEVICGCMFAGKTEQLIDRVRAHPAEHVRAFKHAVDDRYHPSRVVSHNGRYCQAVAITTAAQLPDLIDDRTVLVAIDEGHFFDDDLPEICDTVVRRGVSVVVASLDCDCWGGPFPMIDALRNLADTVHVKSSCCAKCGRPATRTQRLTPITQSRIVGGAESFEPRCDQCWTPPPPLDGQRTRDASNTGPCAQHNS